MSYEVNNEPAASYSSSAKDRAAENDIIAKALSIIGQRMARGDVLSSPVDTHQYLSLKLGDREQEVFSVIFLDNRNQVIAFEELFYGTIDGAAVYPREVAKRALPRPP